MACSACPEVDQRPLHSDAHLKIGLLPAGALKVESAPALVGLVLVHRQQDVAEAASVSLGREVLEELTRKPWEGAFLAHRPR